MVRSGRVSRIRRHERESSGGTCGATGPALAFKSPMATDAFDSLPHSPLATCERPPPLARSRTTTCAPRSRRRRARRHRARRLSRPSTSTACTSRPTRFALRTAAPDDIRAAVALLEEQTNVQALAPVDSRNRGVGDGEEGRAQGRVLHGQPPDRADPRAGLGDDLGRERRRRAHRAARGPRARARGTTRADRRSSRTRRSRDRSSPVPVDVRRSRRDRHAHAPAPQAPARRRLRVRHLRARHARRRPHAGARPEQRSATACTRQRRRVDPLPLLDRQPALRSGARPRRSARARLPQHHRREVLLAVGAARRDEHAGRAPPARGRPRRRSGSRWPTPQFNERELIELGCPRTAVAPILIDFADYDTAARRRAARRRGSAPVRAAAPTGSRSVGSRPTSASTTCCSRSRCTAGSTTRAPGSRSSAARAPGSTGGRCTGSRRISASPTRSRSPTSSATPSCSPATAPPTCSCSSPSTKASTFPCSRRCTSTCPCRVRLVGGSRHRRRRRRCSSPTRTRSSWPTAVERLRSDASLRQALVEAGRKRVEHFSIARTGPHMLDSLTHAHEGIIVIRS